MVNWGVLLLVLSLGFHGARGSGPAPVVVMYRVWEEQPVGTRVGRLLDDLRQRGETGSLEDFRVVEHGQALPFSVEQRDGAVSTLGQLDREELCRGSDLCELDFSVLYRRGGAMHFLRVRVEVMDLNDHSPVFPSGHQEVELSETAALRMRIPLDRAVDPDAGPNGLQTYSLSVNQHFALDVKGAQAELVVVKELDRELQATFDLSLVAWDKGNPPRSGSALIRVTVLDSNDNSPAFEDGAPSVELDEDTARGTVLLRLRASDPDQGPNGEVEYSLSKHAPRAVHKLFSVDPSSGALSLAGPLDYEAQSWYEVDVQARDRGPDAVPTHCKVHVRLRDVNDNAPRIHVTWTPPHAQATAPEGAPEDTFVALVMVSDADAGDNGRVHALLRHGSGPFRLKRMGGQNYMVVTNGTLDRETVTTYDLTLEARDHGDPPLSCVKVLTVHVLDENDNAPVFARGSYTASVPENNAPGLALLTLEARDLDLELSGRVSYSLRDANELASPLAACFSLHPSSGLLSALQPLDHEETPWYSLVVEAADQGRPPLTGTTTVLIQVQDVNDNAPVVTEPATKQGVAFVSVPVNAEKGEVVTELGNQVEGEGKEEEEGEEEEEGSYTQSPSPRAPERGGGFLATIIRARDPDSGLNGQLRFSIEEGDPLFSLDGTTGHLTVNTTNATELIGKTFQVVIAVADMGSPSLVTKATLEVTFINLRDHLKNSAPGNRSQLSFSMTTAVCLGAGCLLLLLAVAMVTTFCRPEKRENRAYNCREAESTYTRHPRRPQQNIRKSDIQLVPVVRGWEGRYETDDEAEAQPMAPSPLEVERQYCMATPPLQPTVHSQELLDPPPPGSHSRTLRKPGSIDLDGAGTSTLPRPPAAAFRTLRKSRHPSSCSSSSSPSHASTLRRHGTGEASGPEDGAVVEPSQATLRRPRQQEVGSSRQEAEHRQMLRNLVRLSMAAFGDGTIQLSSASPDVQQVSQLLSLLHQGQLQPRPNFRGNKYSHRAARWVGQDADWQSTKDSGHGESEPGDMDWDLGRDSPVDPLLEEGLHHLLGCGTDDVFADAQDPAWMARLSLPLAADYHDNVFVPSGLPSPDDPCSHDNPADVSSSFSTFGKTGEGEGAGPLGGGGALLSDVSSLFEMLMSQKADAQPRHNPDVLYRLSAACRRSLGPDAAGAGGGAGGGPGGGDEAGFEAPNWGNPERRSPLAPSKGVYL